jgi:hypothetical protein
VDSLPDAQACMNNDDCDNPFTPICDNDTGIGQCRACENSADCTDPAAPACLDNGSCGTCDDNGDCPAASPVCMSGACVGCTPAAEPSADCDAHEGQPFCGDNQECVACRLNDHCVAADPAKPVCSPDGACVGCTDHGDCPSEVCDLFDVDGDQDTAECMNPVNIIYVAAGAMNNDMCDQSVPCATINHALSRITALRTTVRVRPGIYSETVLVNGNITATLVGTTPDEGETLVRGNVADMPSMQIIGTPNVTLDSFSLSMSLGASGGG